MTEAGSLTGWRLVQKLQSINAEYEREKPTISERLFTHPKIPTADEAKKFADAVILLDQYMQKNSFMDALAERERFQPRFAAVLGLWNDQSENPLNSKMTDFKLRQSAESYNDIKNEIHSLEEYANAFVRKENKKDISELEKDVATLIDVLFHCCQPSATEKDRMSN